MISICLKEVDVNIWVQREPVYKDLNCGFLEEVFVDWNWYLIVVRCTFPETTLKFLFVWCILRI